MENNTETLISNTLDFVFTSENWKIRELHSKQDAIKHGKNRGWCTANPKSFDYDNSYSKFHGSLFLLYKRTKQRPHAQLFVSKHTNTLFQRRCVELRTANNVYVDVARFIKDNSELTEWFAEWDIIPLVPPSSSQQSLNAQWVGAFNGLREAPQEAEIGQLMLNLTNNCMYTYGGDKWIPTRVT